jgi:hypothetical protein
MEGNLIAVLGKGRGTWGHVARIIQEGNWQHVLLIGSEFSKENFSAPKECEWVLINPRAGFETTKEAIKEKLPNGSAVVSLISGTGKEHMALLAALKEKNVEFKIVVITGDGIKVY